MTVHKVGRRRIPVKVTINHQEKTIWSVPVSSQTEDAVHHHELETIYDFEAVTFPFEKKNQETFHSIILIRVKPSTVERKSATLKRW